MKVQDFSFSFFSFGNVNNEQLQCEAQLLISVCGVNSSFTKAFCDIGGKLHNLDCALSKYSLRCQHTALHEGNPCISGYKTLKGVWVQSVTTNNQKSSPRWHSSSSVSIMYPVWTVFSFCNKVFELKLKCGNYIFLFFSDFTPALLLLVLSCSQVSQCVPVMSKGPMTDSCVLYARSLLQNITDTLTQVQN